MENQKVNPVVWFEIYVDDMQRAQKFYEDTLKMALTDVPLPPGDDSLEMKFFPSEMTAFGSSGALVKMEGFGAGGNSTLVYFSSDDCSIEAGRIEAAGGKLVRAKMSIGEYGFVALGTDTEGNMFGIHSMN
ncbi:VOC family protein [Pareuzebyella sediminis]|uniref:VOC family protein n=1 Tax=Pareuzebyella sediminis TaxID=2607998 RepID=UPI0011EFAE3C|nr:VOC family protein [Pareuzebyella sediminis]